MNKKILVGIIAVLAIVAVVIGFVVNRNSNDDHGSDDPTNPNFVATISEVAIENIPEEVKAKMEADMETPGAHSYDVGNERYVLLTTGKIVGLDMAVDASIDENEAYLAVTIYENTKTEEKVLSKTYKTTAQVIHVNDQVLINPYLKVGAVGINKGFIEKEENTYFITPIMDDSVMNRVFLPGDVGMTLENGLYEYTYEVTNDGMKLLTATPVDSVNKNAQVVSCDEAGLVTISLGVSNITFEMLYDFSDADLQSLILDIEESGRNGMFTITTKNGRPYVSELIAVRSFIDLSQEPVETAEADSTTTVDMQPTEVESENIESTDKIENTEEIVTEEN